VSDEEEEKEEEEEEEEEDVKCMSPATSERHPL
jgi:hypothetical protein